MSHSPVHCSHIPVQGGRQRLLVCLFVCEQGGTKTTEWITMKLGGRMWYESGKHQFNFGADPDRGADPGITFFIASFMDLEKEIKCVCVTFGEA